jgi:hypothetical protein
MRCVVQMNDAFKNVCLVDDHACVFIISATPMHASAQGLGLPIIGTLLGHTQTSTTQRYAHLDADPLGRASAAIGVWIATRVAQLRKLNSFVEAPIFASCRRR